MSSKKIDINYLKDINKIDNEYILKKFGNWTSNIDELKKLFINNEPFEHIIIDNFLSDDYAEEIYNEFPTNYENWYKYINPLEIKFAYDNINLLNDNLKNYFYYLSSDHIVNLIKEITGIENIEFDDFLHGAGLHSHPNHGRLNIHLDYEKHPISGKERRINIIYFTTKNWDSSWNGANELWDKNVSKCVKKTDVVFNRAIIFKTNEISWHGLHDKIVCPNDIFRKTLAYYYISELDTKKPESEYRKKAKFVKSPNDKYCEKMEQLYKIRENRLITNDDLKEIMPEWKIED
jgi:Rps23 Pro-64 3,4-dihydroxylase Tpa1-like proline 4-hydroxylase